MDIFTLDKMGLWIGAQETNIDYERRTLFYLSLKEKFREKGMEPHSAATPKSLQKEVGIDLEWLPIFFGNERLRFWEGGALWEVIDEENVIYPFVQLKKKLKTHEKIWFYTKEEILGHEMIHAARLFLFSQKYEEFLAYRLSPSRFRRYFGPIFQSNKEVVFTCIFFPLLFYFLFRLNKRHQIIEQAVSFLKKTFKNGDSLLYRLTDEEIDAASQNVNPLSIMSNDRRSFISCLYMQI